jgi:hypothetical protein
VVVSYLEGFGETVPEGDNVEYDDVSFLLLALVSVVVLFLSLRNRGELVPEENLEAEGTLR